MKIIPRQMWWTILSVLIAVVGRVQLVAQSQPGQSNADHSHPMARPAAAQVIAAEGA